MSQSYEFYCARAKQADEAAAKAELANVRERELRAAKTWRGLADHARGVAEERAKIVRDKRVEERTAEAVASNAAANNEAV